MKKRICKVIIMAATCFAVGLAVPADASESLDAVWKEGLRFTSADKAFELKVGGRIMNDWVWLSADSELENSDIKWNSGTEFRRARLYIGGHIYKNVKFKAQYDFAKGAAHFKDVYIAFTKIPVLGSIKTGHFKQPFGLEELTSSKYITFMERAMPIGAFAPSRNSGFQIGGLALGKKLGWAVSTFRLTNSEGKDYGDNAMNYAARITYAPVMNSESLVHLGLSYVSISPASDEVRFKTRPEMHLAPVSLADTGTIAADGVGVTGVEAAAVLGPLSLQGEYIMANVSATQGDSLSFSGYYAFISWFATGERRPYKHGAFSRVKPDNNFGDGPGAIELAARVSNINLNDGSVTGGEVNNYTLGLNWYLNPNSRVMVNYVIADKKDSGKASATMARFQIDF